MKKLDMKWGVMTKDGNVVALCSRQDDAWTLVDYYYDSVVIDLVKAEPIEYDDDALQG